MSHSKANRPGDPIHTRRTSDRQVRYSVFRRGSQHRHSKNILLGIRETYSDPKNFEDQQVESGHYAAQKKVVAIAENLGYIGNRIVSLACGRGKLDRELIYMRERDLAKGGELRLLGVDISRESIQEANLEMQELISRHAILRRSRAAGRLAVEYKVANIGGGDIEVEGESIPNFAAVNLRHTVIGENAPDTYLAFMIFVLWADDREAIARAIAEKSRKEVPERRATFMVNGEEYPTHLTPDKHMKHDFMQRVQQLKRTNEMDPNTVWRIFFDHGLRKVGGGRTDLGFSSDDHTLHYAFLKYVGGTGNFDAVNVELK